jgi:hypothetical protein
MNEEKWKVTAEGLDEGSPDSVIKIKEYEEW